MDDKISDDIFYLFLTIVIPLSIKYSISAYYKRKRPQAPLIQLPPYPASRWDLRLKVFLIACSAWYFYRLYNRPYSFLTELGVEVNSPSFQVRNHFRDYMTERFPGWVLTPLTDSQSSDLFDKDLYSQKIRPLEELYDKLRSGKWRRWYGRLVFDVFYSRFGHSAIVNCNWCLDENDFSAFGASETSIDYVIFLFIFGLGTMTPRKIKWRSWIIIGTIIGIPLSMDLFSYAASPLELTSTMSKDSQRNLFFTLHSVRNCFFAISLFIIAIWDPKRSNNDADVLQEVCRQSSVTFGRLSSLALAQETITNDPSLRDEFFKFYQENQTRPMSDEEVQKLMQQVPAPLQRRLKHESELFSKNALDYAARLNALRYETDK